MSLGYHSVCSGLSLTKAEAIQDLALDGDSVSQKQHHLPLKLGYLNIVDIVALLAFN